jgi:hypothetical protein
MKNIDYSGKRDDKLLYNPSMSIIGWLAVSLAIWATVLLPYFMLS